MSSRVKQDIIVSSHMLTTLPCDVTHPLAGTEWLTLVTAFLEYKSNHSRPETVRFYMSRLMVLCQWAQAMGLTPTTFTEKSMGQFIKGRREDVSETTLHHDGLAAKVMFRYAYEQGKVDTNPLLHYRLIPQPSVEVHVPTSDELRKLLQTIKDTWNPTKNSNARKYPPKRRHFYERRNIAIVIGLAATACRSSELFNLSMDDINFNDHEVTIHKSKTHAARTVPVGPEWLGLIRDYLRVRPQVDTQALFVDHFGEPMTYTAFRNTWQRYRDKAGLHHLKMHGLRHKALTAMYVASGDLKSAMDMAGHKSTQTAKV